MNGTIVIEVRAFREDHETTDRLVVKPGASLTTTLRAVARLLVTLWPLRTEEEHEET